MQKLPLNIGQEIAIRSQEREYLQTSAHIVGARVNEFIIVDNLILEMNKRLFVRLQGEVNCNFILGGNAYVFESQVLDNLAYDMNLIRYPDSHEVQSLREHSRIRIQLEVRFALEEADGHGTGMIVDLSEGGCRLMLDKIFYITSKMKCRLSFDLPDGGRINDLKSSIRTMNVSKLKRKTELGLQFIGPKGEINKISHLCGFCRRFQL